MAVFTEPIIWTWECDAVPYRSGGDHDVYTKPGRTTSVTIRASDLRIRADGRAIVAHVHYRIHEDRRDYTTLQYDGDVEIPVRYDWKVLRILQVSDYRLDTKVYGQRHDWIEDDRNLTNTCVMYASFKIDDVGDDDTGNAGLFLKFRIPVEVEGTRYAGAQMQEQGPEPAPSPG